MITFALFNLYVPVNYGEKKDSWQSIFDFLELHSPANIIAVADLNLALDRSEKKGGARGKDFIEDVVEKMIQDWDLVDLKPKVGRFMWSNQ